MTFLRQADDSYLEIVLRRMQNRLERINAISRALGVDDDEIRAKLMGCLRQLATEQREDSEAIIAWQP